MNIISSTLSLAGQQPTIDLPQVPGTRGSVRVSMHGLNQSGLCSYDPSFANTAGYRSAIPWIDTENSVLLYCDCPVDQLARQCDFPRVAYIMLSGDTSDEASYQTFRETIIRHTLVHEQITRMHSGFRRDSHPMVLACTLVGALAALYHDVLDVENPWHRALAATRPLPKMPTTATMSYKYTIEQPTTYPRNDPSCAGNFLRMLFTIPMERYVLNLVIEQAMNQILVLHAGHGQYASTTTVRAMGSSGANLFVCAAAGLTSLWGPMHDGANESNVRVLEEIESVDQALALLRQAKRDPQTFRRLDFGNSRYRHCDPRAGILHETSHWVLAEIGASGRLLQATMVPEDVALTDPYFVSNGLSLSVDFHTVVILKVMNLPSSMFTVVTMVDRTVGWVAYWNRMHQAPLTIYRPRQTYVDGGCRDYVSRRSEQSVDPR